MCGRLCFLLTVVVALSFAPVAGAAADPDIIGWWWFDEGAGTTAADSSGNGNNGTLTGGASWAPGYFRTALQLDGVDGYVDVPNDSSLQVDNEATVMAWINTPRLETTSGGGYQGIIGKGNGTARSYSLYTTPSGMHFSTGPSGAYIGSTSTSGALPTNEWVHVCGMIINNGHQYYVNGEDAGSAANGAVGPGAADTENLVIGRTQEGTGRSFLGLIDDVRVYRRGLTQAEVQEAMTGKDLLNTTAGNPIPGEGETDVRRDVALAWTPGQFAASHDVYFGTNADDVNAATRANPMGLLVSQGQTAATYDPAGLLDIDQTYYWRIDEVNAAPDNTIFKGYLWSFTTEPLAYPIAGVIATSNGAVDPTAGPENTVNGSGLNADDQHSINSSDMWLTSAPADEDLWIQYEFDNVYKLNEMLVWNYNVQFEVILGFGLKDVTVEYSVDGADWAVLGDVELAKATANATYTANSAVDMEGVAAKYVRLTVHSGWGQMGQYGLSEVRFMYIPVQAREPQPGDGATGVEPATGLAWRPGREAVSHDVYLGTDPNAMDVVDTVSEPSAMPGGLEFGQTYYWQIVEVNDAEAVSAWAGDVWSFSTQEYALIDGFEDYNDDVDAGTTIFDTWLDGWVNDNGSTVGYFDAPFAEQSIVNSGRQSMPLAYDNSSTPFYSEAERVFASAQDWTLNGADTLVIHFQGVPGAFTELASGKIILGAAGADIWNAADEFRFAYKPLNGNGSIVALVDSVANTNAWAKGGVMIRETLDAGSAFAAVYATPGNGCRYQARLEADAAAVSDSDVATAEQIALTAPHWVKIERIGNTFNGYYSTDGTNWTAMVWNPQDIPMASNVYIGLALTSHSADVLASAEFSDVATTGDVTGNWAVETIGVEQPEGNAPSPLYVTLEDATGKTATVTHPAGEAAVFLGGWNEWPIPFSEFSGVNLSRVEVLRIGVGNAANPTAGGTGIVYIDDIGYGHPAAQ